jgi:hypothetical protein
MSNRKYRPKIKQGHQAQPRVEQHDAFTQSLLDDLELVRKFARKVLEASAKRCEPNGENDREAAKFAQIGVRACSLLTRVVTLIGGGSKVVAEQAKAMTADARRLFDQAMQKPEPARSAPVPR